MGNPTHKKQAKLSHMLQLLLLWLWLLLLFLVFFFSFFLPSNQQNIVTNVKRNYTKFLIKWKIRMLILLQNHFKLQENLLHGNSFSESPLNYSHHSVQRTNLPFLHQNNIKPKSMDKLKAHRKKRNPNKTKMFS